MVKLLGAGGMGVVWQAWDERLHRTVAIKMLRAQPELTDQEREILTNRAMREARITAGLHHPHAVPVFDVVEHAGQPCLVMQLIESTPLSALLKEHGTLTPLEAARIGADVSSALAAAHKLRIVHRDVKPGNILITADGSAMISDFGISHALGDPTITATGLIHGTPAYLAPEVARGQESKFASDVYSLGSTLYAMLEGAPPFGKENNAIALLHKVARGSYPAPRHAGVLAPLLREMLSADPRRRPDMNSVALRLATLYERLSRTPATADVALPPPAVPPDSPGATFDHPSAPPAGTAEAELSAEAADTEPLAGTAVRDARDAGSVREGNPDEEDETPETVNLHQTRRYEAPTLEAPPPDAAPLEAATVAAHPAATPAAATPVVADPPLTPTATPPSGVPQRHRRRRRWALIGLVLVAAIVILAVLVQINSLRLGTGSAGSLSTATTPTASVAPSAEAEPSQGQPTTAASEPSAPEPSAPPAGAPEQQPVSAEQRLVDTITTYYSLLPADLASAWPMMTADYQVNHVGGRAAYEDFWAEISDVAITDVSASVPDRAQATLTYYFTDGRVVQEVTSYRLADEGGTLKIAATTVISSIEL
ncbi:serine/threonine-protein kinase [Cryobacterium sp.]|uniref:serine/threonine-protein kinase n=1 Tax=Cryobacterium sp. TaxID=1926290 RepID=UPI002616B740|nr:serine/threonine-protein kinase [Cryobacterium sp.]